MLMLVDYLQICRLFYMVFNISIIINIPAHYCQYWSDTSLYQFLFPVFQAVFTSLKETMETPKKSVKSFQN